MSNLFDNEQFKKAWEGFNDGDWADEINVRDFIQQNYTPYEGDDSFLVGPTQKTKTLWNEVNDMIVEEVKSKKIKVDLERFSGINNFDAGYIDKDNEVIFGLQTDELMIWKWIQLSKKNSMNTEKHTTKEHLTLTQKK